MTKDYLIYGAELSPYSVKVRSYLRYKEIPHQWIIRNQQTQKEFNKLAKIQVIPLVVTPEQEVRQDSTPIIHTLEEKFWYAQGFSVRNIYWDSLNSKLLLSCGYQGVIIYELDSAMHIINSWVLNTSFAYTANYYNGHALIATREGIEIIKVE